MSDQHLVIRDDDPERAALEADGRQVVATSWGARLFSDSLDPARLRRLVDRAAEAGGEVLELGPDDHADIFELDARTCADYPPDGPATFHTPLTSATAAALTAPPNRAFGIRVDGRLAALTAVTREGDAMDTEFTAVTAEWRGRGLGAAVKAASVLALLDDGVRTFRTGGAGSNDASLAANRSVGYTITERWLTYAPASHR